MDDEEYSSERPSGNRGRGHGHRQASTSELMESAKVVAGAAQSAFARRSAEGIDKARVSEAAEELLDAAKKYGKLEGGSGLGSYLDKAEGYLHNLHSSESGASPPAPHGRQEHRPTRYNDEEEEEEEGESRPSRQEHRPARYNDDDEEESRPSRQEHRPARYNDDDDDEESRPGGGGGGGIGDYLKMAQGFLK